MKQKNRNAWILPHCLSLHDRVEIVEFDAAALIGGIINPANETNLPADLTDREAMKNSGHHAWGKQIEQIIKVNNYSNYIFLKSIVHDLVRYLFLDTMFSITSSTGQLEQSSNRLLEFRH